MKKSPMEPKSDQSVPSKNSRGLVCRGAEVIYATGSGAAESLARFGPPGSGSGYPCRGCRSSGPGAGPLFSSGCCPVLAVRCSATVDYSSNGE